MTRLLEAARRAPSANNLQEWRFVVVRNPETREKISQAACGQSFIATAPVVLACCAETNDHIMTCNQRSYPIDVAIAVDHITLCASAEGLGTCWIGAFNPDAARDILGIPKDVKPIVFATVGYSDDEPKPKVRKSIYELVRYKHW